MLSRVADSLYWLSRSIERAENLARIVRVSRHATLEARKMPGQADPWKAILSAIGLEPKLHPERGTDISHFIAFGKTNPDSIQCCIANARENARMVRDQISQEMWLELNGIHLYFTSGEAKRSWDDDPSVFTRRIIQFSLLFQGLTDATILHDEGWKFVQLGKFIERADKTSRILDILTYSGGVEKYQCAAILRSCSGFLAFRAEYRGDITLPNITSFLLFSQGFPRSVRFCVRRIERFLHQISTAPAGMYSNEAERIVGSLVATMNFYDPESIQGENLHAYLDSFQTQLNEIGQHIFEAYVLLPSNIKTVTQHDGFQPAWQNSPHYQTDQTQQQQPQQQ